MFFSSIKMVAGTERMQKLSHPTIDRPLELKSGPTVAAALAAPDVARLARDHGEVGRICQLTFTTGWHSVVNTFYINILNSLFVELEMCWQIT